MINTRAFLADLQTSIKAALEGAGYRAIYQSPQLWAGSFHVSNSRSQGGVSLSYGKVCESCGESIAYRVVSARGTFGARVALPKDADAATVADHLVREVLPLLTNRLPAATHHNPGVGVGLLSANESSRLAEAIESHAAAH